jgi:hypothetical protein
MGRMERNPKRTLRVCVAAVAALVLTACGASSSVIPGPSDVRADLGRHGIDLEGSPVDAQGCVVMKPSASNSGAVRTYGQFSVVIAKEDSCNEAQMTGSAGDDHVYWSQRGRQWLAKEKLEDNLWLRMTTASQELGDEQHALEKAAFRAFDTGT